MLLDPEVGADPRGLRIHGAVVVGGLELNGAAVRCALSVTCSHFVEVPDFGAATLPALSLSGSAVPGLRADGIRLGAGGFKADQLSAEGVVRAVDALISGSLRLQNAELKAASGPSLSLDRARIDGELDAEALHTFGRFHALGAVVGGQVNVREAVLNGVGAAALSLDRARIGGGLIATGLKSSGAVRARGAVIAGQVNVCEAQLQGDGDAALSLGRTRIEGGVFAQRLETAGEVRAIGLVVAGQLNLREAVLDGAGGPALNLDRARVDGNLIAEGVRATGEIRARGAALPGVLNMDRAVLDGRGGIALTLDRARSGGGISAREMTSSGGVRAVGAVVAGRLDLEDAVLNAAEMAALNLRQAEIGELSIPGLGERWAGEMEFDHATVAVLDSGAERPEHPAVLKASGWTLGQVTVHLKADSTSFGEWLAVGADFESQPWAEVASFYHRVGQPGHARRMLIEMERRATGRLTPTRRWLRRILYGGTVGYGYRPMLALIWLAVIAAVAGVLTWWAPRGAFVNADDGSASDAAVGPTPWVVAMEAALPAVDPVVDNPWEPIQLWMQVMFTALGAAGWLLGIFFVAGVTGILRKTN
ncbi:hypothetical protein [Brachybacterium aquaticum]|uniref:Cytoskeletal protein CcmA (Bactofilin family) n=1 Tax=Brachybacterium aquaticum TaxID=1432564 RepID=A0A841AIV0_9MICO|nr:hypothetical protein [Brachybacterium aquaticum]MBB5833192.1 cytoskeletal protein CcmA (bactofilin family) [Brachybacterium aquaticum]